MTQRQARQGGAQSIEERGFLYLDAMSFKLWRPRGCEWMGEMEMTEGRLRVRRQIASRIFQKCGLANCWTHADAGEPLFFWRQGSSEWCGRDRDSREESELRISTEERVRGGRDS